MDFTFMLEGKGITIYECSKRSGIPYSTLSDLMRGRTPIENASFRTAYYLASALGITMEDLYDRMHVPERCSYETFKSQVRHDVKRLGDICFIEQTLDNDLITKYWHIEWFFEAFYLLGMVDYLSRINNICQSNKYDKIREYKLPEVSYPSDIILTNKLIPESDILENSILQAIPEFMRFNIVEKDIRDVY